MLQCVLVLFTLVGGLTSSLKGLYGHLLGHASYFKNKFLLFRDNSCVTPGGVWGSNLWGELRRTGSFDPWAWLPPQEAGRMLQQVPPREGLGLLPSPGTRLLPPASSSLP